MTRDEKKAQTRQRLLDAAAEVFARRGLDGASLDEIAAEAGLTKGAVYSNFANKEELVFEVLDESAHERMRATLDEVDFSGEGATEAQRAGRLYMKMDEEQPAVLQLWLEATSYAARSPEFLKRFGHRHREAVGEMIEVIEDSSTQFDLSLPMPADEMGVLLNALGMGLAIERLLGSDVPEDLFGRAIVLLYGQSLTEPDQT